MPEKSAAGNGTDKSNSSGFMRWLKAINGEIPGFLKPFLGFSLAINILLMVSPLYMLQVYDRVLTSGSSDTLIWLTVLAVFLLAIYAAAEMGRRRLCTLAAENIEDKISEQIFVEFETKHSAGDKLSQNLNVLGRIRGLFQNHLVTPFFDLPFTPLFFLVLFLVHPVIGFIGLGGGAIIFAVAVAAEMSTRGTNEKALNASAQAHQLASGLARQRSAMVAMGLCQNALQKWRTAKEVAREFNLEGSAREGTFSSISRSARQILQTFILGAGAALAISQEISPGAIVAGSIVLSRALAPIDQIVGSWRAITQCRVAWQQLESTRENDLAQQAFTPLPRPSAQLTLDRLSVAAPGSNKPMVHPFSLQVNEGDLVALVGGNGAGKTTLLQTLAGAWEPLSGSAALGNRNIHSWHSADRGQYVGYVPQDVELLPGTVGENIARMSDAEPEAIFAAAQRAGAHEMILKLPQGYDTQLTSSGQLSAGQRQLIGLARALFGEPALLLLDEPTANLDREAGQAVIQSLQAVAKAGAVIVIASHDRRLIAATATTLLIRNGSVLSAESKNYLQSISPSSKSATKAKVGAKA
ncbi:type I secretion system permease/ATPase [Porticoccus sp. W117]|uniref:type I secretion system permease/ATPase n=1 Tax=Porticoccus sp. W117 TaxID=3054777 RepID=UPI0025992DA0|nr:type I secretion system permease/ATPase [Porticoccus sp. W117]MDM3871338.1 type I secretion system permease/ATPase [Porticoccus sp. W117]